MLRKKRHQHPVQILTALIAEIVGKIYKFDNFNSFKLLIERECTGHKTTEPPKSES